MEKVTVKELMAKLENANPDSPIDVKLYEANETQQIEISAIEITVSGVTIHGDVTMVTHGSNSEYENKIVGVVVSDIKNGGVISDTINKFLISPAIP